MLCGCTARAAGGRCHCKTSCRAICSRSRSRSRPASEASRTYVIFILPVCGDVASRPVTRHLTLPWVACVSTVGQVPADLLVLYGQAVVDEAILTGESLPQLKTALPPPPPPDEQPTSAAVGPKLDMEGRHRAHVMFSGTRLIRIDQLDEDGIDDAPAEVSDVGDLPPRAALTHTFHFAPVPPSGTPACRPTLPAATIFRPRGPRHGGLRAAHRLPLLTGEAGRPGTDCAFSVMVPHLSPLSHGLHPNVNLPVVLAVGRASCSA